MENQQLQENKPSVLDNAMKISITGGIFIVALSVAYYLVFFLPQKSKIENPPLKSSTLISSTLNVSVLATDDGLSGKGMYADKYPSNTTINTTADIANKLGAFGIAGGVWLGLRDWTGQGTSYADGSSQVDLYPVGGSASYGTRISYSEIPACVGCMVDAAAPYFTSAMQTYNNGTFGKATPITIPSGLVVTPISSTLVSYSYPGEDGLTVRGVAYYNYGNNYTDPSYYEAKFALPTDESDVADFLIKNFISQENLK